MTTTAVAQLISAATDSDAEAEHADLVYSVFLSSLAVGLFTAQHKGLLRFPAGPLCIGEIESAVGDCIEMMAAKALPLIPTA